MKILQHILIWIWIGIGGAFVGCMLGFMFAGSFSPWWWISMITAFVVAIIVKIFRLKGVRKFISNIID